MEELCYYLILCMQITEEEVDEECKYLVHGKNVEECLFFFLLV